MERRDTEDHRESYGMPSPRGAGISHFDLLIVLHTAKQSAVLKEAGVLAYKESEPMLAQPLCCGATLIERRK